MKLVSFCAEDGVARVGVVQADQVYDVDDQVARLPVPAHIAARLAQHGLRPAAGGMLRLLQAG